MKACRRTSAALAAVMLATAGCATVPPPGYRPQSLVLSTHELSGPRLGWGTRPQGPLEEVRGVHCTATNDRGSWTIVTPGVLEVERSAAYLRITCRREGYREASVKLLCAVPGTQAADAVAVASLVFPAAILILLPATAIGAAAAAKRDGGEPNYCLYGAGSAVQLIMER